MPSYDYRCQKCKSDFTVERSMKDESHQHCIECGSEDTGRIWTAVALATGGSTADYGQGTSSTTSSAPRKSACGSCVSRACGTCH
ncbi:MAG TPA: zinc ribbon domain-containing protein [Candidatus Obscuribacterales bacterium]